MTWHPISEPPPHPERPHTAMLRRTDHECVCLLPGPVMWDASTRRWTRESGAPIRFDADAEYHWRDEEDILADPRLAHLADGAPLATDTQEYLKRGERPASHRKFVIEADHTAMYSDGRTEWNTRLVSLESAPRAPSQVTEPLAVPVTESPNPRSAACCMNRLADAGQTVPRLPRRSVPQCRQGTAADAWMLMRHITSVSGAEPQAERQTRRES